MHKFSKMFEPLLAPVPGVLDGQIGTTIAGITAAITAAESAGQVAIYAPAADPRAGRPAAPLLMPVPTSSGTGVFNELLIPGADSGAISIPSAYNLVSYNGTGTVIGGSSGTALIGQDSAGNLTSLNANGGFGTVLAGGGQGQGQITDSATGAQIIVARGNFAINSQGNRQNIALGNGVWAGVTISGASSTLQIGDADSTVPGQLRGGDFALITGTKTTISTLPDQNIWYNVAKGATGTVFNMSGTVPGTDTNVVISLNEAATINGSNGNLVVFNLAGRGVTFNGTGNTGTAYVVDDVGGSHVTTGLHTVFWNEPSTGPDTIRAGGGANDTIFAQHAVNYHGENGASLFFDGKYNSTEGANTISAAANATIYGGAAGGAYSIGGGTFFFTAAAGGSSAVPVRDIATQTSLSGGGAQFFLYTNTNELLTVTTVAGAVGSGLNLVATGSNTVLDATNALGHDTVWMLSTANSGGVDAVTGAATILGSTAGNETFTLYMDNASETAHTIDIQNWQASNTFSLWNAAGVGSGVYNPVDVAAINAFNAGGQSSFTLSDGTTVSFSGNTPTHISLV